jgi:hypothetical protein
MPSRRLAITKPCGYCGTVFHPAYQAQVCCSYRCSACLRVIKSPEDHQLHAANRARREAYAKRLGARIRGLTPGQIWRLAYTRGYQACWHKVQRGKRAA